MLIITHPACLKHDTGPGHPESAARLQAVLQAARGLASARDAAMIDAPRASREALLRVHSTHYLEELERTFPERGRASLDADTAVSPGSREAAWRAAGAVEYATGRVLAGDARRAFCAVRPPGHHAEPEQAMGFCLFNNLAVGVAAALAAGLERVSIVDFDVHHGNGTAKAFRNESRVQYCSLFQHPFYPGRELEPGKNDVFVPLAAGTGGEQYRDAFSRRIEPELAAFRPELIFVSAGFDAHAGDPLAGLALGDSDYAWLTERIVAAAGAGARGRVVSVLEGGYDLANLRSATRAHLQVLGRAPEAPSSATARQPGPGR